MTILKILLFLTVFLVSLIESRGSFGYEQAKVLFFIISISAIGFTWLLARQKFKWNLLTIASVVFILALFLTSFLGIDSKNSLLGSDPYFQGLVLYAYLWLFSLLVASAKVEFRQWAFVLSLSATLVAFVAVREWIAVYFFHQPMLTYAGRVVSTFGQPNFYSGFVLLTLPFTYYLFKNSSKKIQIFWLISGMISILGIFISFSRSAMLLTLILLVLALISQLKSRIKIAVAVFLILTTSAVLAFRFSLGIVGDELVEPFVTKNPDLTQKSVEKRIYIWPQTFNIILQRPLLGFGLENGGEAFAGYFEKNKHAFFEENLKISPVLISLKELRIDRSHNYVLDLLLFSGLLGLLGWLGLLVVLFRQLGQTYHGLNKNVLLVSLVTYLVWIQFQNQSIVHLVYFWLIVGLAEQRSKA
ncbi:O-antigen ligase family protein [Patescibacteria group bacterium]|nr:O-antigen ligase family protein [Patescibacteria group bacterium]